jgi:hypothetical protein
MRKLIFTATVIASMFPYTQILPLSSYTQPYALIFAIGASIYALPMILRNAPTLDNLAVVGLLFVGLVYFLLGCLPYPSEQDIKSLLMYVSPFFFYAVAFGFARLNFDLFGKIVAFCATIWLIVGLIQALIHPSFASQFVGEWSGASEVVVASGRGIISLAPEPTHHAFHMLLMASIIHLLRGQQWLIFGCILSAILLAQSASAILALGISAGLLFVLNPLRLLPYWVSSALFFVVIFMVIQGEADQSDVRALQLMSVFFSDPFLLIQTDYSVNVRLGGLIAGVSAIIDNFFVPAGLSNEAWLLSIPNILAKHPWLFNVSTAGIPSGIGIIVYQIGFFGLFITLFIMSRVISASRSLVGTYLLLTALIIFCGQYLISNPLFGLLFGCVAALRASTSYFANTLARNAV